MMHRDAGMICWHLLLPQKSPRARPVKRQKAVSNGSGGGEDLHLGASTNEATRGAAGEMKVDDEGAAGATTGHNDAIETAPAAEPEGAETKGEAEESEG